MKKDQVLIGNLYSAKVWGRVVPVRITEEVWLGEKHSGWKAVNTETGRAVRIKSAQRLRAEVGAPKAAKLATPPAVTPVAGDVGPGGAGAGEGAEGRKAASPRPPKPT